MEAAPADGLQTPSGLATPSGMASVVSTVAAGLETPDFLELRKTSTAQARDEGGSRQLYSVLPEKQASVRGLMGSERGYDISGVVGASVPVLGEDRGTKVCSYLAMAPFTDPNLSPCSARQVAWMFR
jgi:splicing factor 3B subunit 2